MNGGDRRKWLVVASALCVSVFFLDRFVTTPLWALWQTRSGRIAELDGLLEEARNLTGRRDSLDARWREMTKSDLPESEAEAESAVLRSVGDWAGRSGLEVTAFKPRWSYDSEEAANLECRVSASGSMRQVVGFLYELETGALALKVEELSLSANNERGSEMGLDLRFTGVILREVTAQ